MGGDLRVGGGKSLDFDTPPGKSWSLNWTKNSLEGERMDVDVCLCAIGNGDISMLDTVIVVGGWSKGPFEPEPRSCYL